MLIINKSYYQYLQVPLQNVNHDVAVQDADQGETEDLEHLDEGAQNV